MCFFVQKGTRTAKIATRDIKCLKVLKDSGDGLYSPSRTSTKTKWNVDVVNTAPGMKRYGVLIIEEGLHSMRTFAQTKEWTSYYPERKVYMAVIPAGSIYWQNKKEYVSDALKIVDDKPITEYRWRKLNKKR